jgi:hypothetical protein
VSATKPLPKAAVLDTNLVLLYLAVQVDANLLSTYKRLTMFVQNDIDLLLRLLGNFKISCTTSSVLTEVSNLLQHAPAHRRLQLMEKLAEYATSKPEQHIPSADLVKLDIFFQLGFTDATLSRLAERYTVITTDFHLAGRIQAAGCYAINFNHFRSQHLLAY